MRPQDRIAASLSVWRKPRNVPWRDRFASIDPYLRDKEENETLNFSRGQEIASAF